MSDSVALPEGHGQRATSRELSGVDGRLKRNLARCAPWGAMELGAARCAP